MQAPLLPYCDLEIGSMSKMRWIAALLTCALACLQASASEPPAPTITEVNLTADTVFLDVPDEAMALLEENGLTPGEFGPWFEDQTGPN